MIDFFFFFLGWREEREFNSIGLHESKWTFKKWLAYEDIGEGNGDPLQYSWLENPMEPGGLQSMESQRVGHDWATNTHEDISQDPALFFKWYKGNLKANIAAIWLYVRVYVYICNEILLLIL